MCNYNLNNFTIFETPFTIKHSSSVLKELSITCKNVLWFYRNIISFIIKVNERESRNTFALWKVSIKIRNEQEMCQ